MRFILVFFALLMLQPCWGAYERVQPFVLPDRINALAPRAGIIFDGTVSSRVASTLVGQNIGTDPFSVVTVFKLPTVAPSADTVVAGLSSNTTTFAGVTNRMEMTLQGNGGFLITLHDGSNTRTFTYGVSLYGAYGGKTIMASMVRTVTPTILLYINGAAVPLTDIADAGIIGASITSTYFNVGFRTSTAVFTSTIYSATLYNTALTAADMQEIYELGGAVPYRFQFGSQVSRYTSDFSVGLDAWGENAGGQTVLTGNIDAIAGVDDTLRIARGSTGTIQIHRPTMWSALQKMWQVSLDYYLDTSSGVSTFYFGQVGTPSTNVPAIVEGSWQTNVKYIYTSPMVTSVVNGMLSTNGAQALGVGKNLYLKNVVLKQLGAVVHLPFDDGLGYQLRDTSTNNLHGLMTTTGISHAISRPNKLAHIRYTTDGTTSAQRLSGGTTLPPNSQILRIRAHSLAGTPSITMGVSSGGATVVASVGLTTTWKDLTIGTAIMPSATDLWITATAANVIEIDISWEQLSP